MKTQKRILLSLGSLILALLIAAGVTLLLPASLVSARTSVAASNLPPASCSLVGMTRTCELWATTGTLTLPDTVTVPIWGFTDSAVGSAQLPGPPLVANAGETLEVVLHNELLTETVSLTFPGQMGLMPDLEGVAAGSTITYTFTVTEPGTYLYEAGMTPNGMRQVMMGLHGALIVRPNGAADQAYDDVDTAFDDEALVVLGAIDPEFNNDPYGFAMQFFSPEYWLINGEAYPDTVEIDTAAGNAILLRYINATHETQGMGLLGLRQRVVGSDGHPILSYGVVNETIAAGQTLDALTTVPASTTADTRFALYNTSLLLHNSSARMNGTTGPLSFGGMMTFINVVTGQVFEEPGPAVNFVNVAPNPTTGTDGVTLTVQLDDSLTGGSNVVAAEFFTDTLGTTGTGVSIPVPVPSQQVTLTTFIPSTTLDAWPNGLVTFYVHGQDASGKWGSVGSAYLNLDKLGPRVTGMSVSPNPTNGSRPVNLLATGDDRPNGNANVVAATYQIDGGTAIPMVLARTDKPVVAMSAVVPTTMLSALSEGTHTVDVTAQDALGTWGTPGTIDLVIDRTGPQSAQMTLTPNTLDLSGTTPVVNVRLEGYITDTLAAGVQSPLANAEAFIDRTGPAGTGFDLFPSDGLFDEVGEKVYFDIPISTFLNLSQGTHTVYAHGLDAAGNWGAVGGAVITIDRGTTDTAGPDISTMVVSPNPTGGAAWAVLTGQANDPQALSDIATAEYYVDADPGEGNGAAVLADDGAYDSPQEALTAQLQTGLWADGSYTVYMRAQDSVANWGPVASFPLDVSGNGPEIMSDGFDTDSLAQWSTVVGTVESTANAAIDTSQDAKGLQVDITGGAQAYVSTLMPAGERNYQASFYFDPNGSDAGSGMYTIFAGYQYGAPIFGIEVDTADQGQGYKARAWTLSNGVPVYTAWYALSDAAHQLEIDWEAGVASDLAFQVDGEIAETVAHLDTSAYQLYEVRLGLSSSLDATASGAQYFDSFEANRVQTNELIFTTFMPMVVH